MKKNFLLLALAFLTACANNDETTATGKPENDVDAARMFIRSALDGKWREAKKLIVQDSANIEDLETAERVADKRDALTQRKYRESQITIHDTRKINDSNTIVIYSNTFMNKKDSVKVVRTANNWLVDLRYSFPNAVQQ